MTAARKLNRISVEDYLACEMISPIKHEYVGGTVYAMAGARNVHNTIAGNTFAFLHGRLRGKRCRPCNSDTKVRVYLRHEVRFYYPEVQVVVCKPNPPLDSFQDEPVAIFEVLSDRTRPIYEGEKKDAYLTIPSLGVYVLIEQDSPLVVAFRKTERGIEREVYEGLKAVLPLSEIDTELPLAEIYEGVEFAPEPVEYADD